MVEVAPGLWRWTARHPEWPAGGEPESVDDWDPEVGCVLAEVGDVPVVVDPLLVEDEQWAWLEERLAGRRPAVLQTIRWHGRSVEAVLEHFGGTRQPPPGVEGFDLEGALETVFWLPEHAALVPGDRLLTDAAHGLRMCPQSWLELPVDELRERLRPLLALPVERILVSHGEPVLTGAREALAAALA